MKELYFNAGISLGFLSAVLSSFAITQGYGLLAALLALTALGAIKYTESHSRISGRDRQMKFLMTFSVIFYEVLLLAGLLMTEPVSQQLAVMVFAVVFATEILRLELLQEMQRSFELALGNEIRVVTVAASFFAYSLNEFYLFYGALLVGLIAFYDLGHVLRQVYSEL